MSVTAVAKPEATEYQAAWDESLKKHKRFSRLVNYPLLALTLGLTSWFGIEIFNNLSTAASATDPTVKQNAISFGGAWTVGFMLVAIILGMISQPFLQAVGWSEWGLGERPADDYKPREAKPVDVTIEQVNEDLRYFHVSGLYRPDENYTFKIERLTEKRAFRQPEYSYSITEKGNKIALHSTMDSSCYKGMSDAEITTSLIQFISFQLETNTNHFKELNFAI